MHNKRRKEVAAVGMIDRTARGQNKNIKQEYFSSLAQHKQFGKIFTKLQSILLGDKILGLVLPNKPEFLYRKAI